MDYHKICFFTGNFIDFKIFYYAFIPTVLAGT